MTTERDGYMRRQEQDLDLLAARARPMKDWQGIAERRGDEIASHKAEIERLRAALVHVRSIIVDGAETGFNCHSGDWAQRLFASQAVTHAALKPST